MINIQEEFFNQGFLFDKTTQSLSSIPHNFNSCRLKLNDYVTSEIFNDSIKKLYYNFLYLYRGCKIANFKVFKNYNYNLSSSNNFPFFRSVATNYSTTSTGYSFLTGSVGGVMLPFNKERNGNVLIFADRKSITCIVLDKIKPEFKYRLTVVEPLSGDIKFDNIVDIKYDDNNFIFVADSKYKNIYKYDIKNFILNENIYQDNLFLVDVLGGDGGVRENNKFKEIKNISVNSSKLVVQDFGNKSFKLFDNNLNWISTTTFTKIFNDVTFFECIKFRQDDTLLCGKDKFLYEFVLDGKTFTFKSKYDLSSYLEADERLIKIEGMGTEENMLYLVTNKSVKKVWINTLDFIVGEIKLPERDVEMKWISVNKSENGLDAVTLYGVSGRKESFSFNLDDISYNSLLNVDDITVYSLSDCYVKKEEYVQSFTILKSLEKVYINTISLLQNIKYKFYEDDTVPYPLIFKKDYNKNFLGFIKDITFEDDFNIGLNEIFQAEVINRCIEKIVQLQTTIVLFFINNESAKEYLSPNPGRNIVGIKDFVYFADESVILNPNPAKMQIFENFAPGAGILTSLGGAPYTGIGGINISEGVNI